MAVSFLTETIDLESDLSEVLLGLDMTEDLLGLFGVEVTSLLGTSGLDLILKRSEPGNDMNEYVVVLSFTSVVVSFLTETVELAIDLSEVLLALDLMED